jgi:hypothetical protein
MKHIKSFKLITESVSLNSDIEYIFSEVIDDVDVSEWAFSYKVDGYVYEYGKEYDSGMTIDKADLIYINFLLSGYDNKSVYNSTLRPLLVKGISKAKHLGFTYETMSYEPNCIFYHNDGSKSIGDTVLVSLKRIKT